MSRFIALFAFLSLTVLAAAQQEWVQRTDAGSPGLRFQMGMAYDEVQEVVLGYGGVAANVPQSYVGPLDAWDPSRVYDLWKYDGVQWSQITVTGWAPSVKGPLLLWHGLLGRVVLLGQNRIDANTSESNKMWSFVFDTPNSGHWQLESATVPIYVGGGVYDPVRQVLVILADHDLSDATLPQTWEWTSGSGTWTQKADAPGFVTEASQLNAMTFHEATGKVILAGDRAQSSSTPSTAVTRVHEYNGSTWSEMSTGGLAPPQGVYRQNSRLLVYDPARQRTVAVDSISSYDFDGTKWRVKGPSNNYPNGPGQVDGLIARVGFSAAFDKKRGVVIRYGGATSVGDVNTGYYNPHSETFELKRSVGAGIVMVNPNISISDPLLRCVGEDLVLHFLVSIGNGVNSTVGITYQWFRNGSPTTMTDPARPFLHERFNLQTTDAGVYQARAIDEWGFRVESNPVTVYVYEHPVITQHPLGRRLIPGDSFALQGAYNSALPGTVSWTKDGQVIPGATSTTYVKTNVTTADAGSYRMHVQSLCNVTQSTPAVITVGPRIVSEPVFPATPGAGLAPVSMSVTGDGAGFQTGFYTSGADPTQHAVRAAPDDVTSPLPMSFTWRRDGVPISNGAKYTISSSAVTSTLQINAPDYEDEGRYDCLVTDASGPAYAKVTQSRELLLHPLAPPYLTVLRGKGPEPRNYGGMVYDSQRRRTVLFGGAAYGPNPRTTSPNNVNFISNDTWEWDGQVWIKRNPATRPPAMSHFGIAYDSLRGRTVVFGGQKYAAPDFLLGSQVVTNDMWEWDGVNWTQITPPSSPPARNKPAMCFDSTRGEILMVGGDSFTPSPPDYYAATKQLWAWNGTQWTQRASLPNGGSAAPYVGDEQCFAFDSGRGVAVLFGPFSDGVHNVWEWNGTTWAGITPPSDVRVMETRQSRYAFYDPVRRRVGLPIVSSNVFPSVAPSLTTVLWWDGTRFLRGNTSTIDDIAGTVITDGAEAGPFGQGIDLAVFDTHRRCLVWHDTPLFLSSGPAHTREMHFSAKTKTIHQPVEVIFASAQNIQLRAIHAGQRPLTLQWHKDGLSVLDDAHFSGSATSTLTITGTTAADAGLYTLRATNAMNQTTTAPIRLTLQNDGIGMVVQGAGLVLSWPGATGILESAPAPNGPWTPIHGISPPYSVAMDEARRFYRVRYP
jgi:hypothetical protein